MRHLHLSLIAIVLVVSLSFGVAILPSSADSGVTIDTSVTVTGGGGGGGGFVPPSNGSVPYTPPNWALVFPSMNQPQSSASSYTPPQQTYIPIPTPARVVVSATPPSVPTTPVYNPVKTTPEMDKAVIAGIAFWAIMIGLFVWLLSWLVDRRRKPVQ